MKVTFHCTASPNGKLIPLESFKRDHMKFRGFSDIGYHGIFQVNGEIEWGRPLDQQGAHVVGHNQDNLGFAFVGTDKFFKEQFVCARNIYKNLPLLVKSFKPWEVYGHYEFNTAKGKTCPNIDMRHFIYYLHTGDIRALEPYLLPAVPK